MSIVKISHLDNYFGRLHVLKSINLDVAEREVVVVIGRSGSGKSTLLRCINFLEEPDHGTIEVDGLVVQATHHKSREHNRQVHDLRLRTGMVFQEFNLFPHLSVIENVIEAPVTVKSMDKAKATDIGMGYLQKVGLADRGTHRPAELSGGEQQRVALARALVANPALIMGDEPTGNLDSRASDGVVQLLRRAADEWGRTIIGGP